MTMATMQDGDTWYMKVTSAGQISIPAEVRRRWGATRVKVTADGDRLVIEAAADNPFEDLIGILAGGRMTSDEMLHEEREVERERERRKWPQFFEGDEGDE